MYTPQESRVGSWGGPETSFAQVLPNTKSGTLSTQFRGSQELQKIDVSETK